MPIFRLQYDSMKKVFLNVDITQVRETHGLDKISILFIILNGGKWFYFKIQVNIRWISSIDLWWHKKHWCYL